MLVVVGGHSHGIGKTAVAAGLIAALPQFRWTAMKITQHGHGLCSAAGTPCGCSIEYNHPYAISEEGDARNGTDSARFLAAGALRSFWLRTRMGQLGNAVDVIRGLIERSENLMVESNSILQFWQPDLYLMVLDFAVADFKNTALRYLDRADALVTLHEGREPAWQGISPRLWSSKPRFPAAAPHYVTPELAGFVAGRLGGCVQ